MSAAAVVAALCHCASALTPVPDTLGVPTLATAPRLDGVVTEREYGAPSLEIPTAAGAVRVWVARHGEFVYVAAAIPDSTFYWGDDFVVSLDPQGNGGAAPGLGDRQWYLRRTLDSSVVIVVERETGRWYPPGQEPPVLGGARQGADWQVAGASAGSGWMVELKLEADALRGGPAAPRIAFRTYNDSPQGWWSWPVPDAGAPAQRVERAPALWIPLGLRSSP